MTLHIFEFATHSPAVGLRLTERNIFIHNILLF